VLDALGDVVALTDANGGVVDRYAYDSWGEQISNDRTDETIPQQLRYRGQYYDEKLGWYWMGDGRQYDPESARYLQPVGDPSFVYANDDPLGMSNLAGGATGMGPIGASPSNEDPTRTGGGAGGIGPGGSYEPPPNGGGGGDESGSDTAPRRALSAADDELGEGGAAQAARNIFSRLTEALKNEIRGLTSSWYRASFDTEEDSIAYHWDKWGRGRGLSPSQYTGKARALFENKSGQAFTVREQELKGPISRSIRITGGGRVGLYTPDGKVVRFRYTGDRPFQR